MHIVRYALDGKTHYGILEADGTTITRLEGSPFNGLNKAGPIDDLNAARVLAPVDQPRIFGLAYNYRAHSQETGKADPQAPVLFMKPGTAVIGHGEQIVYPRDGVIIHFEGVRLHLRQRRQRPRGATPGKRVRMPAGRQGL